MKYKRDKRHQKNKINQFKVFIENEEKATQHTNNNDKKMVPLR